MTEYKVCEKFISINGEGRLAGQLAVFIRFQGCNLECSYCDTMWANQPDTKYEVMTAQEIYGYIKNSGVKNVTLTGGEPLLQSGIEELLRLLKSDESLRTEIETNGAVDLKPFCTSELRPSFTMDYKLPSSGMEDNMILSNFNLLQKSDCVKFVSGSAEDLNKAKQIIKEYNLTQKCGVYISAVFGKIEPAQIVEFMTDNNMNDVNLQLQMHKFIWDPDRRGV